jgi:hypothetical protein
VGIALNKQANPKEQSQLSTKATKGGRATKKKKMRAKLAGKISKRTKGAKQANRIKLEAKAINSQKKSFRSPRSSEGCTKRG